MSATGVAPLVARCMQGVHACDESCQCAFQRPDRFVQHVRNFRFSHRVSFLLCLRRRAPRQLAHHAADSAPEHHRLQNNLCSLGPFVRLLQRPVALASVLPEPPERRIAAHPCQRRQAPEVEVCCATAGLLGAPCPCSSAQGGPPGGCRGRLAPTRPDALPSHTGLRCSCQALRGSGLLLPAALPAALFPALLHPLQAQLMASSSPFIPCSMLLIIPCAMRVTRAATSSVSATRSPASCCPVPCRRRCSTAASTIPWMYASSTCGPCAGPALTAARGCAITPPNAACRVVDVFCLSQ